MFDRYSEAGNRYYVIQHLTPKGVDEAWQLAFCVTDMDEDGEDGTNHIEFKDKYDACPSSWGDSYGESDTDYTFGLLFNNCPDELFSKVVCDNDYYVCGSLFDYVKALRVSNKSFKDVPIEVLFYSDEEDLLIEGLSTDIWHYANYLEPPNNAKHIIADKGVRIIYNDAFKGNNSLETVKLEDSVEKIYYGAFKKCNNLLSVEMSHNISSIGSYAFEECIKLQEIDLPDSLTTLGNHAFSNCSSLKNIIIPYKVEVINDNTFNGCISLENVKLPSNLKSIGFRAFGRCEKLKTISIPEGIQSIDANAFSGCKFEYIDTTEEVYNKFKALQEFPLKEVTLSSVFN